MIASLRQGIEFFRHDTSSKVLRGDMDRGERYSETVGFVRKRICFVMLRTLHLL